MCSRAFFRQSNEVDRACELFVADSALSSTYECSRQKLRRQPTNSARGLPELVPSGYGNVCVLLRTKWAYDHIKWMVQKDRLNQDMFLIGSHSPMRRWLAFRFCEVAERECEFVALTSDTSEGDLKSRRELRRTGARTNAPISVVWFDQAVVRAATSGRVLILEGLEKAERNVLPILNNLLENREMQLEDGRFLVAPKRYDALMASRERTGLEDLNLIRVHERFRVIAVGVPSPPFPGNPLDPPLRSRFQARHIQRVPTEQLLLSLRVQYAPNVQRETIEDLLSKYETLWALGDSQMSTAGVEAKALAFSSLCYPCEQSIISAAQLLESFPSLSTLDVLERIFPANSESGLLHGEAAIMISQVLCFSDPIAEDNGMAYRLVSVENAREVSQSNDGCTEALPPPSLTLHFSVPGSRPCTIVTYGGGYEPVMPSELPPNWSEVVIKMAQSAALGNDICLIGPKGEGKSYLARHFAAAMGYIQTETLFLYDDMTARDLLQRRSTNARGESIWESTPLGLAMESGRLCILDGLHRLGAGTIAALVRLIQDREISMYDGATFVSPRRWEHLTKTLQIPVAKLRLRNVRPIHPAFRILGLADPSCQRSRRWLTNEVMQLFHYFTLPPIVDFVPLVTKAIPACPLSIVEKLVMLRKKLLDAARDATSPLWVDLGHSIRRSESDESESEEVRGPSATISVQAVSLSLRQIIRSARRASTVNVDAMKESKHLSDVADALESALMTEFMPVAERAAVREILRSVGFVVSNRAIQLKEAADMAIVEANMSSSHPTVRVGDVVCTVWPPKEEALVPSTLFFDIPQQKLVLKNMLRDVAAKENLLLMGNQGVGKNKMADKLLMLLHREREYIQLHRDTTVSSLTLAPSMRDGIVVFDDSPLVKAMIHGRVLLVDEFDKAPIEVVVVLKALLEDGEILLSDGRRFVRANSSMIGKADNIVPIHPEFLVIALANRPGFPFLGNDFFREMGDCFACFAVQNPDQASEMLLLRNYAPGVSGDLLHMLTSAFRELREAVDAGLITYPYSTRELTNIVRHVAEYPGDAISAVLENVFAFDAFDQQMREYLFNIFQRHGIPLGGSQKDNGDDKIKLQASSGAVVPRPLTPPSRIGYFVRQRGSGIRITCTVSQLHPHALVSKDGIRRYRDISSQEAENLGGVLPESLVGKPGAEWVPLKVSSARSERFSEEDVWWRIGMVTREGVTIKGADPLRGSWLGKLLAMGSVQDVLCILTSRMELHVYDLGTNRRREIPLRLGPTMDVRSTYAKGRSMVSIDSLGLLVVYDQRMGALIKIFPKSAVVNYLACAPPHDSKDESSAILAGSLGDDLPIVVLHALMGRELVLVDCTEHNRVARCSVDLPSDFGIEYVRVLGGGIVLLQCRSEKNGGLRITIEVDMYCGIPPSERSLFQQKRSSSSNVDVLFASLGPENKFHSAMGLNTVISAWPADLSMDNDHTTCRLLSPEVCSPPISVEDFPLFAAGHMKEEVPNVHFSSEAGVYAKFAVGMEISSQRVTPIMGYERSNSLEYTIGNFAGETPPDSSNASSSQIVTCTHKASRCRVQVSSVIGDNNLAVRFGVVLVEIISLRTGEIRELPLTKFPGLGIGGLNRKGNGTRGSLANQGLKVTTTNAMQPKPRDFEMPSCIACCETPCGRLALLFSDAHIRILEIRQDKLAVQEALFRSLTGKNSWNKADIRAESLTNSPSFEENARDKAEFDEGSSDSASDNDSKDRRGNGIGRGNGQGGQAKGRGGRGKGRTGRGKGQMSNGDSSSPREVMEAKAGAVNVLARARDLANRATDTQRSALDLEDIDEEKYAELFFQVENEVSQLRVVLQAVEAKEKERSWLKGKTSGELDDNRIVDLAIGEKNVYKRRGEKEEARLSQRLPKRMSFLVDVSGSMAYFNSDQRLDRLCATVVMLMESLAGLEHKYQYEIVGHSGETHHLPLVPMGEPPLNRVERLNVIKMMIKHASSCRSGDNTLASSIRAVREVRNFEADDYFVFLISDANLEIYGVTPEVLADALMNDAKVNAYAIFIAEPEIASAMSKRMPNGRAHVCNNNLEMPMLFKGIFSRAMLTK